MPASTGNSKTPAGKPATAKETPAAAAAAPEAAAPAAAAAPAQAAAKKAYVSPMAPEKAKLKAPSVDEVRRSFETGQYPYSDKLSRVSY